MFTQRCFIRKNNQELIKYLESLGRKIYDGHRDYLYSDCYEISSFDKEILNYKENPFRNAFQKYIDCGTNEELFKAIAALSDNTDIYQWFTDGNVFIFNDSKRNWHDEVKAEFESYGVNQPFKTSSEFVYKYDNIKAVYNQMLSCKKATVQELIEYFKNK